MQLIKSTTALAAILLAAAAAQAVKPEAWTASSKKDYEDGTFSGAVVDSYGQLTLGRQMTPVPIGDTAEIVPAFAQTADGAIYAAVNPDGKIYRIDAGKPKLVYNAPKGFTDITALAADPNGNLLVALAGKKARVIELTFKADKPTATTRFENDNVDNIWAIAASPKGDIFLGTGPHGNVYRLDPKNTDGAIVLESTAKNVTALAFDKDGNLLAGTDAKGLVIRVDQKTQKPFVLLDAGAVDVNALAVDKDGSIFVATAKIPDNDQPDQDEPPETKSKPGDLEPDPLPPADDAGKKGASAPPQIQLRHEILAANQQGLPPELKKLLAKAASNKMKDAAKDGPATKKKNAPPSSTGDSNTTRAQQSQTDSDENAPDTSAVYRIAPTGAVTALMHEADMNYSLLIVGDDLLVGTGDEGKLFRYRRTDQSLALLARLKESNVTSLFAAKDGQILAGTANAGNIYRLGAGLADTGTYTSPVLDAEHSAAWGRASLDLIAALPPGTTATISTRSSNTRSSHAGSEKFWSDWSPEFDGALGAKIASPEARYLQYRITLTSNAKTSTAPVVNKIRIVYQTENLPPKINAVNVQLGKQSSDGDDGPDNSDATADSDSPAKSAQIAWDASDPNGDTLVYRIMIRTLGADAKEEIWTPLAKDLKDSSYDWDIRTLPDGKYQIKVLASDKPDNTAVDAKEVARVSAPIIIDHTPPVMGELKASVDGNKATLSGDAADALSVISDVRYQIDSQGDWQPAAASDKIFDSPHEGFTIVTAPLTAGGHRITVRATDAAGNSSYKTATIIVKP